MWRLERSNDRSLRRGDTPPTEKLDTDVISCLLGMCDMCVCVCVGGVFYYICNFLFHYLFIFIFCITHSESVYSVMQDLREKLPSNSDQSCWFFFFFYTFYFKTCRYRNLPHPTGRAPEGQMVMVL